MSVDFIPTRASIIKNKSVKDYEEVTYVSYKPKGKKPKEEPTTNDQDSTPKDKEFNIKKAKQEVIKLGMSGFDTTKKEEAKIQQLIKLGAKPPRNKFKNYKQLLNEKRIVKEKQAKEETFQQLGKNKVGKSTAKGKSFDKKRKEGILGIYGKIVRQNNKSNERRKK